MKKILVTGSRGQLGQTLQEKAMEITDLFFTFKDSSELDITKRNNLAQTLLDDSFDYCINCAAYTNVEQAEKTPGKAFLVNAEGAKNLAEACRSNHVKLVHISTDYVFDGTKTGAYTIDDRTNPINEYGKSKLKGEEYIREILDEHYIVRTSWLYSKKYGHNFYRSVLKKVKAGETLRVTDAQKGCPTDTENLVDFLLNKVILECMPFGTYHFTDGQAMTWYDFANKILQENGLEQKANLVLDRNYRTFAKRPKNSVLS